MIKNIFRQYVRKQPLRLILFVFSCVLFSVTLQGMAAAASGEEAFVNSCSGCHSIGEGDKVGPDLSGITLERDHDWLVSYIREAATMKKRGDVQALKLQEEWSISMPDTGLTPEQAEAVITFVKSKGQMEAKSNKPIAGEDQLVQGNVSIGKKLFSGTISFQNGGVSCLACHNVVGLKGFGGGTLGPDLTNVFNSYGKEGLTEVLSAASMAFPTMKPVYDNHPLTKEEAAHLTAYFEASLNAPAGVTWWYYLIGLVIAMLALLMVKSIWRSRLGAVRRELVKLSYKERS